MTTEYVNVAVRTLRELRRDDLILLYFDDEPVQHETYLVLANLKYYTQGNSVHGYTHLSALKMSDQKVHAITITVGDLMFSNIKIYRDGAEIWAETEPKKEEEK
jgi:hypothetical protein